MTRFLSFLPNFRLYVESIEKKKVKDPKTKSFKTLKAACADASIEVKLNFLISVAQELEPFLEFYQSDKPLMPFINSDLFNTVRNLLRRFMKEEVVCAIEKASHLKTLKLDDDNLYKKTDLGFKAENILSSTLLTRESSLRSKARKLLIEVCERLIKKTPLAFPVANYVSCLNPMFMHSQPQESRNLMEKLLRVLTDGHHADLRVKSS